MFTQHSPSGVWNDMTLPPAKRIGAARLLLIGFCLLFLLGAVKFAPAAPSRGVSSGNALNAQDELDEVTLTLRSEGFDPSEIMRPAGPFMLSVDNRSGLDKVTLALRRGDGNKVLEIKVLDRYGDWSERIELQPGRYTLSETGHPDWKCSFLINEKK